ncbi:MAG: nucleoside-diphosphate kinase [Candidatus Babeliaceae bacterium]|jgi:nucleoside-diphosphate kinase
MNKTCAIIKPDAVTAKHSGNIISLIELNGFTLARMEKMHLTRAQAEEFYAVHSQRSFFGELVDYMISGPVIVMALEKENAIQEWRDLMGATNPAQAAVGTIRKMFGTSIGSNATHGSDSAENAAQELKFFFAE